MSEIYIESRLQAIKEIVCGNCSSSNDVKNVDNICQFCDEIASAVLDIDKTNEKQINKSETQTGWIPCSERLPEEYEKCLVTEDYIGHSSEEHIVQITTAYYVKIDDGRILWSSKGGMDYKVTAWMPLPEPYQEEKP